MLLLRVSAWFSVLAATSIVAAACSTRRPEPGSPDSRVTVQIGTYLASTAQGSRSNLTSLFTAEPLVAAGWDGRPVFKLAESVSAAEDGRQLRVMLRSDARFHTGDLVTAPVITRLLSKKIANSSATLTPIAAVAANGDREVVFTLLQPRSMQPEDLGLLIVDDDVHAGLRTGPFRVASEEPLVLEPFPQYYEGRPTVDRLEIHAYGSHRVAWTALMRREVNVLHEVNRDAIEFVQASGDVRTYPLLRPFYQMLAFNVRHPVLARREVRLAINEAIDRAELLRDGMRGHGRVAEGPFWPYHWAYPHGRFAPAFNREAARLRLEAAGLPIRRRHPESMPSRFAFTCLVLAGDARFERMAQLVQRQLFAVGIDMRLEPVPFDQLTDRARRGRFEALLYEANASRILKRARMFWRSAHADHTPLLNTGYRAADGALDGLQRASTDEQIRSALADVMRLMRTDPPAAFLAWPRETRAADISMDIPYEIDRDIFGSLWQARRSSSAATARR